MKHGPRPASVARAGSPEDDRRAIERVPNSAAMNQGMQVLSYLISGVLCYGLLGWLGDHLLGTGFLLPLGVVVGAGLGIYVVVRRFGQIDAQPTTTDKTEGTT